MSIHCAEHHRFRALSDTPLRSVRNDTYTRRAQSRVPCLLLQVNELPDIFNPVPSATCSICPHGQLDARRAGPFFLPISARTSPSPRPHYCAPYPAGEHATSHRMRQAVSKANFRSNVGAIQPYTRGRHNLGRHLHLHREAQIAALACTGTMNPAPNASKAVTIRYKRSTGTKMPQMRAV